MVYAKRWCFTMNNYTKNDVQRITECLIGNLCVYAIVAREKAATTGTPHLQGFVHFKTKKYLKALKKMIGNTAHLEVAKGSDVQNKVYCEKDGDVVLETGEPMSKPTRNKSYLVAKEMVDYVCRGGQLSSLLDSDAKYVEAYVKHTSFVDGYIGTCKVKNGRDVFNAENLTEHLVMYRWQVELYDLLLKTQPDGRKVLWYVDEVGAAGKSTFCNYFMCRHKAVCFTGGKFNDLAYVYDREPVVFFDLVRSGSSEYFVRFYGTNEERSNL